MKEGQLVRQGDVLIRRIARLPKGARRKHVDGHQIVVEFGEQTGHCHTLDPKTVEAYDILSEAGAIAGQAFRVLEATPLLHQEHSAIVLEPGFYERWVQIEDDGESERQVAD